MIREIQYPTYSMRAPVGRASWGAIWGGAFVSNAALGMLSLLGLGIGLLKAPGSVVGAGAGGAAWLFCTAVLSFFLGGWVTGRMTHSSSESDNAVHALVSWSVSTVVAVFFVALAMGGALNAAAAGGPPISAAAIGGMGIYAFCVLICEALAAIVGARSGTRLLRPVVETRTHRVESETPGVTTR